MSKINSTSVWHRLPCAIVLFQVALLVLFAIFVTYDEHTDAKSQTNLTDGTQNQVNEVFPVFLDVHAMIFIGFSFLYAFMKQYGFAGVAFNFLMANLTIQWAVIVQGFFHFYHDGKIHIGLYNILAAEFACAAILISFGAVLGKTSPAQLVVLILLEVPIYSTLEWVVGEFLKVSDVGGSIIIHVFAAFFGLTVTRVLYRSGLTQGHPKDGPSYQSDLLAMLGTLLLWVFWPTFNSAVALKGDDQHRAALHTFLSLSASTVTAFVISIVLDEKGKIKMAHIQNATLAGGVAIGAVADMMISPAGAITLGCLGGMACTLGFEYLTPFLAKKLKIQDQCGINNLHGIPGIISAIAGIVCILLSSEENYGLSLYETFPHMSPQVDDPRLQELLHDFPALKAGFGRRASDQALYQAAALAVTIATALVGGCLTGYTMKIPFLTQPTDDQCFSDEPYFKVPHTGEKEKALEKDFKNSELTCPFKENCV
ncbi:ammonium transporter Rh type A-like [Protopterus annectens]|uniref:ammonium transporter Rh type A-like n=1 Tax=Protopterus annectens TaxID=7888 RepID=UPI001CF9C69E|nr:ammonium transporter Rh type A-like [Protopterus annectens]